jgi:hypothetical protein
VAAEFLTSNLRPPTTPGPLRWPRCNGAAWTDVSPSLLAVTGAPLNNTAIPTSVALSMNPDVVYVTFGGFSANTGIGHIYRSTDFGESWARSDGNGRAAPLPDEPTLRLLVDRTDSTGNTLLAGTSTAVFRSSDGGVSWTQFNALSGGGLVPEVPVFDLQQNLNGVIYSGTHGRGVYMLTAPALGGSVSASVVNSTAVTGQTNVNAGSFTIANSSGFPEAVGSLFVPQSGEVFTNLTLTGQVGGSPAQTANTAVLPPTAVFVFNPPLNIPAAATANFRLTGTAGMAAGQNSSGFVFAGVASPISSGLAVILFGPALLAIALLPLGSWRRRISLAALILLLLAAGQVGCGGGGGNSVRIAGQSTLILTAVNGAIEGGAATFSGIPVTVSNVTLVF